MRKTKHKLKLNVDSIKKGIARGIMAVSLLILTFFPAEKVEAQASWGIGASYEMITDSDPSKGFGVHIERGIFSNLSIVDMRLRAHFSYFSEQIGSFGWLPVLTDQKVSDFGLAVLGGVNLNLLKPYVGAGVGRENFKRVTSGSGRGISDDSMYLNLYAGAQMSRLPLVKPFIEYRFTRFFEDKLFDHINRSHNSRISIGIMLEF